jgi:hypothetical protein
MGSEISVIKFDHFCPNTKNSRFLKSNLSIVSYQFKVKLNLVFDSNILVSKKVVHLNRGFFLLETKIQMLS